MPAPAGIHDLPSCGQQSRGRPEFTNEVQHQGCSTLCIDAPHRDRASGPAPCARKPSGSFGDCPVTSPFAFFALFADEILADCRGGPRAVGPGSSSDTVCEARKMEPQITQITQMGSRRTGLPSEPSASPRPALPKRRVVPATGLGYAWLNGKSQSKPMATFDQITCIPTILNGQPTIRGMRLSVRRVIEALAVYPNWDDLRREYPELEPEDIRQALEFAARNLDESVQPLETV